MDKETIIGGIVLVLFVTGLYYGLVYIDENTTLDIKTPAEHYALCSENTENKQDRDTCIYEFDNVRRVYDCFMLYKHDDLDRLSDSADLTEFRKVCIDEINQ